MPYRRIVFQILIILAVAVISGLIYNSFSEQRLALIYYPPKFKAGTELTTDQAYGLFRDGRALFIDTRYKAEYDDAHIKNAINLPYKFSIDEILSFIADIPEDQIIVLYCANPSCYSSRRMAAFLIHRDYRNVFIYLPGLDDWVKNNHPTERANTGTALQD
jgi:rhodanese-related sulfurtransferase